MWSRCLKTKLTEEMCLFCSFCDLPMEMWFHILDFATTPETYVNISAVFSALGFSHYLKIIRDRIFLRLNGMERDSLILMRNPGRYYGVWPTFSECFGVSISLLKQKRFSTKITHPLMMKRDGELVFKACGPYIGIVAWIPDVTFSLWML